MMKFNWSPRLDLDTAIRKAASDFAALPPEKQAEVFRAQRRSFVIKLALAQTGKRLNIRRLLLMATPTR